MYPPEPNVKPIPTSPGTNVTAFEAEGWFPPRRSFVFPSPVHQLTSPDGGATQAAWVIVVTSLEVSFVVFSSPPPDTAAVLVTEAAAFAATLTVKVIDG